VLLDGREVKIVAIRLQHGTPLPEHTSPSPVVIHAATGAGAVLVGAQRLRLDAAHVVCLPPRVPHAVEPDPGTDLVLLVHHVRNGGAA
jgi:quercetin dioxygenase-like cupin family protein